MQPVRLPDHDAPVAPSWAEIRVTPQRLRFGPVPRWPAMVVATLLMIPLAAHAADEPRLPLEGVVWISPTCAGAQREGDPCRAPLAGIAVQLNADGGVDSGRTVASATTDAAGGFAMQAPAGRYVIHVVTRARLPRCPDQPITLPMVKPTRVELECDSGMR
jgi:hypothetical protein